MGTRGRRWGEGAPRSAGVAATTATSAGAAAPGLDSEDGTTDGFRSTCSHDSGIRAARASSIALARNSPPISYKPPRTYRQNVTRVSKSRGGTPGMCNAITTRSSSVNIRRQTKLIPDDEMFRV